VSGFFFSSVIHGCNDTFDSDEPSCHAKLQWGILLLTHGESQEQTNIDLLSQSTSDSKTNFSGSDNMYRV